MNLRKPNQEIKISNKLLGDSLVSNGKNFLKIFLVK